MRFEFFMAVIVMVTVFKDVTSCSSFGRWRNVRETFCVLSPEYNTGETVEGSPKMEVAYSSETLVPIYQTTRRHVTVPCTLRYLVG